MTRLFVVSAPSGSGKTTLKNLLVERVGGIRFSISHTTRDPRTGETDGVEYHFVSRDRFEKDVEGGAFIEWAEVYGNFYGTGRSELEAAEQEGVDLLLDIDLQGAQSVRAAVPSAILILIVPPSWEALRERLTSRATDSPEVIRRRLDAARSQLDDVDCYDYIVVNDEIEPASRRLESIVLAERQRIESQRGAIVKLLGAEDR